jgi:UPF0755 protein
MLRKIFAVLGQYSIYVISFALGILIIRIWLVTTFFRPADANNTTEFNLLVERGSNLKVISKHLEENKIIKKWYSLYLLGKIKNYGPGVSIDNIQKGEYSVQPSQTPAEILEILLSHKTKQRAITIPEGSTIRDVRKIIVDAKLAKPDELDAVLNSRELMLGFDIPAASVEGFMFPETYYFSKPITPKEIVSRIIFEGLKKAEDNIPGWKKRAAEIGFDPYQAIILASIIEKESSKNDDRAKISSVFFNRLRIGMPLQSDPTVIYGIFDFDGNLTKDHLKTPTPYNTYLNAGLPPTPIANPSLDSIKAALYPLDTDYLYFVSKKDGTHHFSATYREHVNAVNSYQRANSG